MVKSLFIVLMIFSLNNLALAETYYDILKKDFNTADDDINANDIDVPGYPLARICVEYDPNAPMKEAYVMISRYTKFIEGPGPSLPPFSLVKVIFRTYTGDVFSDTTFDKTTTEFSPKVIKSNFKVLGTDVPKEDGSNQFVTVWSLEIRKKGNNLQFKRQVTRPVRDLYGYCYPRQNN